MTQVANPRPPTRPVHRHGRWQADRLRQAIDRILEHDIEQIVADAREWSPGVPAATTEPRVTGSNEPRLPLPNPRDINWAKVLDDRLDEGVKVLNGLHKLCADLTRPTAPPRERTTTVAHCQACGRVVGTPDHPVRRGMCDACYRWCKRRRDETPAGATPPDHTELVRMRQRQLETDEHGDWT